MNSKSGGLGFERRATATAACRVRVSNLKARIIQRVFVVELASVHERKALGIHKNTDAMLRADVVSLGGRLDLHHVLHACAATFLHAQTQPVALRGAFFGQQVAEVMRGGFSDGNHVRR